MWVLQPFVLRPHDSHILTCTLGNKGPHERQSGMLERMLPLASCAALASPSSLRASPHSPVQKVETTITQSAQGL